MWTAENRAHYDRSQLRYPSDLTDEEWALVRPEIPRARLRIPTIAAIDSDQNQPSVPIEGSRGFR